ncbi:hypothetical protein [Pleurochrysis sp. endemic virus 1a]|nr:hypothetical protein [Pleurochrysis sp. endemic virus 1a]|mmetsp:Transcript_28849/g.63198  ORF Transcript_28849/g.63198 Transcript_28849/m.63198 type:complete len:102 (-) Transcript_28849:1329-1634(-)
MSIFDSITDFDLCEKKWKSMVAGAAVALTGLDGAFVSLGAPREAHWALAGAGLNLFCQNKKGQMEIDTTVLMCALGGFVGGFAVRIARRQGVPFTGPLIRL